MIELQTIELLESTQYMIYYYMGIGFMAGAPAGFGFAVRTSLKNSQELVTFYKNELDAVKESYKKEMNEMKGRIRELEERLYPDIIDRREHPRDAH